MSDQAIILADKAELPKFSISPVVLKFRDDALTTSALVGKVQNREQNETAVRAHMALKGIATSFEKQRKAAAEPLLEAKRQLDRLIATELTEVEKEMGRISNLTSEFQLAEQRRVREEEELQRRELARIEAEKQRELRRLADEQAERERAARAAQDAIDRKAREEAEALAAKARTAKQRENAEAARIEVERTAAVAKAKLEAEAAQQREGVIAETQRIQEAAQAATLAEAKPITATRAFGQRVATNWDIEVINPFDLARFHPDCVTITPKLTEIKARLNSGAEVKGIRATKILSTSTRPTSLIVDALPM